MVAGAVNRDGEGHDTSGRSAPAAALGLSTGSIAYTLDLAANAYDNPLARLTANVVEH